MEQEMADGIPREAQYKKRKKIKGGGQTACDLFYFNILIFMLLFTEKT